MKKLLLLLLFILCISLPGCVELDESSDSEGDNVTTEKDGDVNENITESVSEEDNIIELDKSLSILDDTQIPKMLDSKKTITDYWKDYTQDNTVGVDEVNNYEESKYFYHNSLIEYECTDYIVDEKKLIDIDYAREVRVYTDVFSDSSELSVKDSVNIAKNLIPMEKMKDKYSLIASRIIFCNYIEQVNREPYYEFVMKYKNVSDDDSVPDELYIEIETNYCGTVTEINISDVALLIEDMGEYWDYDIFADDIEVPDYDYYKGISEYEEFFANQKEDEGPTAVEGYSMLQSFYMELNTDKSKNDVFAMIEDYGLTIESQDDFFTEDFMELVVVDAANKDYVKITIDDNKVEKANYGLRSSDYLIMYSRGGEVTDNGTSWRMFYDVGNGIYFDENINRRYEVSEVKDAFDYYFSLQEQ